MRFNWNTLFVGALAATALFGCTKAGGENQGVEYAPNMYHSVAYEPLKQITDKEAGSWLSNREDGLGEFFNSNVNNPHEMNMREPVAGTVKRDENGFLPYRLPADSLAYAAEVVKSPFEKTEAVVANGKALYEKFCIQCHGDTGQGDGKVGVVFKGVPSYSKGRVAEVSEGHIFHVITHGKGRMGAHGSQLNQKERWEIVAYVQQLQNQ
ncbi:MULTISPECIES: c-type cytochrome [Persicobacter]|uniref:Cytochrome c domain-containing protein n=1 Tax=Persicobacter diffluens TaxID=981 RepID=A0AAN4W0H2_9BACT|nr:cytochrome c [Persicobacter sp. CCB-QB2]GJM61685.1 hypothetical protein PEDI_22370 [Persicobacter diffluens]